MWNISVAGVWRWGWTLARVSWLLWLKLFLEMRLWWKLAGDPRSDPFSSMGTSGLRSSSSHIFRVNTPLFWLRAHVYLGWLHGVLGELKTPPTPAQTPLGWQLPKGNSDCSILASIVTFLFNVIKCAHEGIRSSKVTPTVLVEEEIFRNWGWR